MGLERKSALEIAYTLCSLKRPRSDDIIRGAPEVLFLSIVGEIRTLDPELKSFVNINSPEDLTNLQPRRVQGYLTKNMQLNLGSLPTLELKRLRDAAASVHGNKFSGASRIFASCGDRLEEKGIFFWAAISRENEGKSLLQWALRQEEPTTTATRVARARKALLKAANNYALEAEMHEKNHYFFLAERATSDKTWCESHANEY